MKLTGIQIRKKSMEAFPLLAIAHICLDDMLYIHDIAVVAAEEGGRGRLKIQLPRRAEGHGGFLGIVNLSDSKDHNALERLIRQAYQASVGGNCHTFLLKGEGSGVQRLSEQRFSDFQKCEAATEENLYRALQFAYTLFADETAVAPLL